MQAEQASEHASKAMQKKEHAGKAAEHADSAVDEGGEALKKEASKDAGQPAE